MAVPTIGIAKGALMGMAELKTELQDRADFVVGSVSSPEDVARLTKSADALVVSLQRMTWAHIAALGPFVRVIGRAGVGLDNIDLEAARQKRMAVVHQPYYATHEVADHAAAMMLAAHRRLAQADEAIRVHGWPAAHTLGSIPALGELSLGILGCGRIGQMVSERMRPFVQRIYALDDRPDLVVDDITMTASLEELLRVSNILSLHLPLTADTKHIIGARELSLVPSDALLVNVSRGGLVDEDALAASLTQGNLRAAALDVFQEEPLSSQSPLRHAPNLLLSPHVAWFSASSGPRLTRWIVEDTLQYLECESVTHGAVAVGDHFVTG